MTKQDAINMILEELALAEKKHPLYPTDPIHAVGIICEESGEAMQAALDLTYGGKHYEKLLNEIVQTGAMAIRALVNFNNFYPHKSDQV